jgi:O-antigen/teichoic acid export membrane protein
MRLRSAGLFSHNAILERRANRMIPNFRLRRFLHAVASSYALLGFNVLYVLGSVPVALYYLQKREFGLWALSMQLTGYLQLVDLGMSGSVSRHLIDYKDARAKGDYGGLIQTGAFVLIVQGVLVLLAGTLFVFFGTHFLRIDPDLERPFQIVMLAQCAILAADFPARLFGHILVAHQRTDIMNYSQMGFFVVAYATLWLGFANGLGIFSLIWASGAGWLVTTLGNTIACSSLSILPARGEWGRATWSKFRDLFGYGKDVFWIALGAQMINASQAIVITRALGLDAAAVWSVCTRTYTLASQLVWRPFDSSSPMLSEMIVRGEKDRLLHRFRGLVILTTSLGVGAAVMFALCNQPFVALWTHGKIGWGQHNDILLSIWLIVLALVHCHCGLPLLTKKIGFMRYVYFIEGVVFLAIGSYAAKRIGFGGVVGTSIIASLAFSFSYGIWRSTREFNLTVKEVLFHWLVPPARMFVALSLFASLLFWASRSLPAQVQLPLYVVLMVPVGAVLLLRLGLGPDLREEFRRRAPVPLSRLLERLFLI